MRMLTFLHTLVIMYFMLLLYPIYTDDISFIVNVSFARKKEDACFEISSSIHHFVDNTDSTSNEDSSFCRQSNFMFLHGKQTVPDVNNLIYFA